MVQTSQQAAKPAVNAFKIRARYPNTGMQYCQMLSHNKTNNITSFLTTEGKTIFHAPLESERQTMVVFPLESVETTEGDENSVNNWNFSLFEYYSAGDEDKVFGEDSEKKIKNQMIRAAHQFCKTHSYMFVKGKDGNNQNHNLSSTCFFELIEESEDLRNSIDKENKKTEAKNILQQIFQNHEEFIDFCYAYNLADISEGNTDKLYKKCLFKIDINPDEFFAVYNHTQKELLITVRKAMEKVIDEQTNQTLIVENSGYYYMNNEALGATEDEILAYFETHPVKKNHLLQQLGMERNMKVEKKVEGKDEGIELTDAQQRNRKVADENSIQEMGDKISQAFRGYKAGRNANNDDVLNEKLEKIKNDYSKYETVFAEYVEKQRQWNKK